MHYHALPQYHLSTTTHYLGIARVSHTRRRPIEPDYTLKAPYTEAAAAAGQQGGLREKKGRRALDFFKQHSSSGLCEW
jgi:hypothetical protein